MSIDDFLINMMADDISIDGSDFRRAAQLMDNAYRMLKAQDEYIKKQNEMIVYLRERAEEAERKLSSKTPIKVNIKPLIAKFEALA